MDHSLRDLMVNDVSFRVNGHDTAQCQTILPCIQRADSIGQSAGQHRNHPVHQIYTGSALQGFPVHGTFLLYIIGYICNMHTQYILVSFHGQRHGIIQIFGIFPINRHHLYIP